MNLIDLKERLVLGEKLEPAERDYILDAINAYRRNEDKAVADEIMTVWQLADEIIGIAVQRIMFKCQNEANGVERGDVMLLGIEIALLRQAARMSLYGRDYYSAKSDAEAFITTAREQFRDVEQAFADEPSPNGRKDRNER